MGLFAPGQVPYNEPFGPSDPHLACSSTPTETGSTAATLTGNCCTPTRPYARRAAKCRRGVTTGDCYDNAQAESLRSRLKTEVLALREWPIFADLAAAQANVAEYFDCFNHERLHSRIDYQTPYHTH